MVNDSNIIIKNTSDITGMVYGRLTVIELIRTTKRAKWLCRCECGTIKGARRDHLIEGRIRSCGCLGIESRLKHGDGINQGRKRNPLYSVWASMKSRATSPNSKRTKDYFGRGISICDEWLDYVSFKKWALENGYRSGLSIDRIDNNRGYSPENCRWATTFQQSINKRTTKMIMFQNKEIPRAEFCRRFQLKYRRVAHLQDYKNLTGDEILDRYFA